MHYNLHPKTRLIEVLNNYSRYVAQRLEHWTFNPQALGSNPSVPKPIPMIISNISHILNVTTTLFLIGMLGLVLNRKNILITIMSVELMLLSVNLNFIIFSIYLDDVTGYVFVMFILTIAATESAIGLAILSAYYKLKQTIQMDKIKNSEH